MPVMHAYVLVSGEVGESGAIIGVFTTVTAARAYWDRYKKIETLAGLANPDTEVPDRWEWDGEYWQIEAWPLNPKL